MNLKNVFSETTNLIELELCMNYQAHVSL